MKVKVKDVAEAAGVSKTAVSLVLNGKPSRVSAATRDKILRIAREMAFQQEYGMEPSAYKKVRTIGLVIPNTSDPYFMRLSAYIQDHAYQQGCMVYCCTCGDDVDRCSTAVESLAVNGVDGVLLLAPSTITREDKLSKMLHVMQDNGLPIVLIDRAIYNFFCDFITSDNKFGGREATRYLVQKGHQKIGCILGPESVYTSQKRLQGYQEGLAAAGIPFDPELVCYSDYSQKSGYEYSDKLYQKGCRSLFVANSLLAQGAIDYAAAHGLKINEDVAIVGYDLEEKNGSACIRQNIRLIAEKAVGRLIERLGEGKTMPPSNFYVTPVLEMN